ncbi:MAG: uroporphyrinogen decarboxylase family protein, partial [Syntrophomonadaceae bacterium]|nr:uroporphyrinogen decarboxylase family protein [Syntrophomonadaceae bacterium]
MHKDDLMTPIERAKALEKKEPVDRMPISMFYGAPGHSLLGWTRRQEQADARSLADVQKKIYEVFGCDGVSVGYGLHGMPVAFGAVMTDPEHQPQAILENPIKDINDLSMLDLSRVTAETDPTVKKCYEAALILREELGHEVNCGMGFTGAFTCASGLVGTDQLLKSLLRQPEQVHKLLDFITRALLQFAEPFLKEGFSVSIGDPVASGTIIHQKQFQEFVVPYARRFVEGCAAIKPGPMSCHICGDTSKLLNDMADCGYKILSLDNRVDLEFAKEQVGNRVHLIGNVDPISIIFLGTPDQVRAGVRECFKKTWDSPCGFTIATGCD